MGDEKLLENLADFEAADAALDRWVEGGAPYDVQVVELHRQWEAASSNAATLKAETVSGISAKAQILISTLKVLAPNEADRQLHERLAISLAHDLLVLEPAKVASH